MSDTPWLLVTVSTAGGTASLRVATWRHLKALGALYLQQSVCLLPDRDVTRHAVDVLVERIRIGGGTARVLSISVRSPGEDAALREQLEAARDLEYAEVLERFPSFFSELETETARGRTTYEELEESEADLTRFRSWLSKIRARDYFDAPRGTAARAELARAEQALAEFADLALGADGETVDPSDAKSQTSRLPSPGDTGQTSG